ncbi:MAG TPA: decaprenyl-phosphate phosphoribosyltransferase [Streptosporangiaceae bacterium]
MTALPPQRRAASSPASAVARWLAAVIATARPRQWPKNLLVLAAPLAAASQGRDDGSGYALVALAAFIAASSAVYFVNDVADAGRDRRHPVKSRRPVASGALPAGQAVALAAVAAILALASGLVIGAPWLSATIAAYLAVSLAYTLALKHVPVIELACVASGFVLRAVGGAAATHVSPSGWFLTVCSLGALLVAVAKRRGELAALGPDAARHRPVMRWYRHQWLAVAAQLLAGAILAAYTMWAAGTGNSWRLTWDLASVVPLAAALARFGWLSVHAAARPVENLIITDRIMLGAEAAWLTMFAMGW